MYGKYLWQLACLPVIVSCFATGPMSASWADQGSPINASKATIQSGILRGEDSKIKPTATKGSLRTVIHIDNQTERYIKIYNNDDYLGTVGPLGDKYYRAEPGTHKLFGRDDDDSSVTWGPRTVDVDEGTTFVWHLQ